MEKNKEKQCMRIARVLEIWLERRRLQLSATQLGQSVALAALDQCRRLIQHQCQLVTLSRIKAANHSDY